MIQIKDKETYEKLEPYVEEELRMYDLENDPHTVQLILDLIRTVPESRELIVQRFPHVITLIKNPSQQLKEEAEVYHISNLKDLDNFSERDAQLWMDEGMLDIDRLSEEQLDIVLNNFDRARTLLEMKIITIQRLEKFRGQDWYETLSLLKF